MVRRINDARQADLGLIEPKRVYHAPEGWRPSELLPELSGVVAVDLETKDPGISRKTGSSWPIGEGFICGVAIADDRGSRYFPLRHAVGNIEMEHDVFWSWLRKQLAKPGVQAVMANATYDTGWLKTMNVVLANPPLDVQVMAFLLDEHRKSYSLSNLSKLYLHRDKGTATLFDMAKKLHIEAPMSNMDMIPAWVVEPYALEDADLTYTLYRLLQKKIDAESLTRPLKLESESTLVAVDMRWQGVRVDQDALERLGVTFASHRDLAIAVVKDRTDVAIAPFDNLQAIRALTAENSAVEFGMTEGGRPSVDRFALERIGSPVAKAILAARKYEKARGTFVEGLAKFIVDGRIHAEFHSTRNNTNNNDTEYGDDSNYGATSGRWASSNPNLQNIPARDPDIGPAVRSCFIPEEGEQWVKLDYASQEPRLTLHFAHNARVGNRRLPGAAEMVSRFLDNPMTDLHGECATLMDISRGHAKTINLALTYGMQGASLCKSLGLPTKLVERRNKYLMEVAGEEGEALLRKHYEAVPFIRDLFELAKDAAKHRGWVKTLSGRVIHFERFPDGNYARVHKALNGVIQGSAADQMKMALVALRAEGLPVSLTVHDEADRSVPMGAEGERMIERMKTIMQDVIKLSVPMIAEAKTGASWGECR